jgi:LacI family transcriptional regulator
MPTITLEDVAREAGVSAQTVSRVVNNKGYVSAETRRMVEATVKQLGYEPNRVASSLVTGRTLSVGVVVPDISNPFFSEIVLGVETTLSQAGYNVTLCNTGENADREKSILRFLQKARVDGVILAGARLEQDELLIEIAKHRTLVSINRPIPAEFGSNVQSDHVHGIDLAVEHMIQCGGRIWPTWPGPIRPMPLRNVCAGFYNRTRAALDPLTQIQSCPTLPTSPTVFTLSMSGCNRTKAIPLNGPNCGRNSVFMAHTIFLKQGLILTV